MENLEQEFIFNLGACSSDKFWEVIKEVFEEAELAEQANEKAFNMSEGKLQQLCQQHFSK